MDVDLIYSTMSDSGESAQSCLNQNHSLYFSHLSVLFWVFFFNLFSIFSVCFLQDNVWSVWRHSVFLQVVSCMLMKGPGRTRGGAGQQQDDCQSPAWWESACWAAHTHARTHTKVGSSTLPSTTSDYGGAWTEKKTTHSFWVAAHFLAPCLQLAVEINVSLDLLHVFKGKENKRGIWKVKKLSHVSGPLWHHKCVFCTYFYDTWIIMWHLGFVILSKWNFAEYADLQMFLKYEAATHKPISLYFPTAAQTNQTQNESLQKQTLKAFLKTKL